MSRQVTLALTVVAIGAAFVLGRASVGLSDNGDRAELEDSRGSARGSPAPGSSRSSARTRGARKETAGEPNEALHSKMSVVLRDPSVVSRLPAWMELLRSARAEDMPGILALFEAALQEGRKDVHEAEAFWARWGVLDGEAALTLLESREDLRFAMGPFRAAQGWASQDPLAALAWIQSRPESGVAKTMLNGAMKGWAENDLDSATAHLLNSPADSPLRTAEIAQGFAWTIWHSGGGSGMASWFDRFAAAPGMGNDLKRGALDVILQAWSTIEEPAEVADLLRTHTGSEYYNPGAAQQLVSRYAGRDPLTAATFVSSMGDEWARQNTPAVRSMMARWVMQDIAGPGNWLSDHADSESYDVLAANYAITIRATDPEAAEKWTQSIKDPELRRQTLDSLEAAANGQ